MRVRLGGILLAAFTGTVTCAGCAAVDGLDGLAFDLDGGDEDGGAIDARHQDAVDAGDGGDGDADACVMHGNHCWQ